METKAALGMLAALAQETRLSVFRFLVARAPDGAIVGEIAEAAGVGGATLSFHLKELAHAGLIASSQEGRFVRYAASLSAVQGLVSYLTENCCGGDVARCGPVCVPVPAVSARKRRPPTAK